MRTILFCSTLPCKFVLFALLLLSVNGTAQIARFADSTNGVKHNFLEISMATWGYYTLDADQDVISRVLPMYPNTIMAYWHGSGYGPTIYDPMALPGNPFDTALGITAYPKGVIDRAEIGGNIEHGRPWESKVGIRDTVTPRFDVKVETEYNIATRLLTVTVSATALATLTGNWNINAYVLEDSISSGLSPDYAQKNGFNTGSLLSTTGEASWWVGAGNPIISGAVYSHMNVVRKMLAPGDEIWGELAFTNPVSGTTVTKTYTYTLPGSYEAKFVKVVGLVEKFGATLSDRAIENVIQTSVFQELVQFANGSTQMMDVCQGSSSNSIDTQLMVVTPSTAATVSWSVLEAPSHGSLTATYSTTASSDTLIPSGLSYTPTSGYAGLDTFSVLVVKGSYSDTTKVIVNVSAMPTGVTVNICEGETLALPYPGLGGWSSSNPSVMDIAAPNFVTGVIAGTATLTYTGPGGCNVSTTGTVNTAPSAITGDLSICYGSATTLSCATSGGTWSSSSLAVASVGSASGLVVGLTSGTATIIYTGAAGCTSSAIVTVYPLPPPISGVLAICDGSTTALGNALSGGTWSVIGTAVNVISPGLIEAVSPGSATVVYTHSGCSTSVIVTVSPAPSAITGSLSICTGGATTLSHVTPGGTWASGSPGVVSVDASTGFVSSIGGAGTSIITYTLPSGCAATATVTVNAPPAPITGVQSFCYGSGTTLSCATTGGTWSSSSLGVAYVGSTSGLVSGVTPGTSTIIYSSAAGCTTSAIITVNAEPAAITGVSHVCVGATSTLSSATTGGAWSASNGNASVGLTTGVVTGVSPGTVVISYTLPSGCFRTLTVLVSGLPTVVAGGIQVCEGSSNTLTGAPMGGTWSSLSPGIASISLGSGVVNGVTAGTASVVYTMPTGCTSSAVVTVNAAPPPITGELAFCYGSTTTLSNVLSGGTWSVIGTPAIVLSPGLIGGVSPGTATVVYMHSGCSASVIVTVNAVPSAIGGSGEVCVGSDITLSNSISGGTWLSSTPTIASVAIGTGVLTGNNPGTTTVIYATGAGCSASKIITVNAIPASIGGVLSLCEGNTTTLTTSPAGGTWSSLTPAIASVTSGSGVVNGISAGTASVVYTLPTGCSSNAAVSVNPSPVALVGLVGVCVGDTLSIGVFPEYTWSTSDPTIATFGSSGNVLTGVSAGTVTITVTVPSTGCFATHPATVYPLPAGITGPTSVCEGSSLSLTSATPGGSWSSETSSIASIGSAAGIVSGIVAGGCYVSYRLPTGCATSVVVTVNPLPAPIVGTTQLCEGMSTALGCASFGGTWVSSSSSVAQVGSLDGLVTGLSSGTSMVSYVFSTGCARSVAVTVNPSPAPVTGTAAVCEGMSTVLSCVSSGGTWTSSNISIASVGSISGLVTGLSSGTSRISYSFPTGCAKSVTVTVNPVPSPITGTASVCEGSTTVLSTASSGGVWISGNTAVATVHFASGIVSGVSAGTTLITYAYASGCQAVTVVTVHPLASAGTIIVPTGVCLGATVTMSESVSGGTWTSSMPSVCLISSVTGATFCGALGTATISYRVANGCFTSAVVTVNPLPGAITGSSFFCEGLSSSLAASPSGGTWSSAVPSVATVESATGVVSGINGGTSVISYTLPTGCRSTAIVTIDPLSSAGVITVGSGVCEGETITLGETVSGGTWVSASTAIASVGAASGVVSGIATGTTTVSYTIASGCMATGEITVNPLPAVITGTASVCEGLTATLSSASSGGLWTSGSSIVATVGSVSGIIAGVTAGTTTISYTLPTGCRVETVATVISLATAGAVSGPSGVCEGAVITLSESVAGGAWMSSDVAVATIGTSGVVSGVSFGTVMVSYTVPTGCYATAIVTVNPTPVLTSTLTPGAICDSTVFSYTPVSSVPGSSFSWTRPFISGITSLAATGTDSPDEILHNTSTFAIPVSYVYTVTAGSCSSTANVTVTVNPTPRLSNPLPPAPLCSGNTFNFTPSSATLGSTFIWARDSVVGISTPIASGVGSVSEVLVNTTTGVLAVNYIFTISANGCTDSQLVTVSVNPETNPGVIVGPDTVCAGSSIILINVVSGGTWTTTTGNTSITGGIVTGLIAGTDIITYSVTGICGTATTSKSISVRSVEECSVSVIGEVQEQPELNVFPNPNDGNLVLQLSSPLTNAVHVVVADLLGQVVTKMTTTTNVATPMRLNCATGMYLLTVESGGKNYLRRIVVN